MALILVAVDLHLNDAIPLLVVVDHEEGDDVFIEEFLSNK